MTTGATITHVPLGAPLIAPSDHTGPTFEVELFGAPTIAPSAHLGPTFSLFKDIIVPGGDNTSASFTNSFAGIPGSSLGPVFDHDAVFVAVQTVGPLSDSFISASPFTKYGPLFDHVVVADVPATFIHGPVSDKTVSPVPPFLPILDPDATVPEPVRNQIVPDLVELLSPNVYGLEKDIKGNIRGFKF